MILGIVGAEAAKFTAEGQTNARELIERLYRKYKPKIVVSGACHLGGIDIWARKLFDGRFKEFPPEKHSWTYYKRRNIQIAEYADRTICIAVDRLPPGFKGMRFRLCYHCGTTDHVKSGGCWTAKYARGLGKPGIVLVVSNGGEK